MFAIDRIHSRTPPSTTGPLHPPLQRSGLGDLHSFCGPTSAPTTSESSDVWLRPSANSHRNRASIQESQKNRTIGQDTQSGQQQIVEDSLKATFCIEPPGTTLSRKGLIDSIVLGCIPVVVCPQQLTLCDFFLWFRQSHKLF